MRRRQHAARRPRRGRAGLRDAWQLCPAGADPGPAGAIFGAWRQLALQPPAASVDRLAKGTEMLGLAWDDEALTD
ncbi:DUF1403 family protein, partial [Mesorhizobium sp.]|uniref:DUF1403 family protein n=1 Tax=Mesorhizobium sp. TaxID=1871066 RepID=UPI0025BF4816